MVSVVAAFGSLAAACFLVVYERTDQTWNNKLWFQTPTRRGSGGRTRAIEIELTPAVHSQTRAGKRKDSASTG